MRRAREKMTKLEALEYIRKVQKVFKDKKEEFEKFMDIMTNYRLRRINVGTVVEEVVEILEDHDDLMLGFNKFLPKGYQILIRPKGPVQMEDAVKYVEKIKERFGTNGRMYNTFINILTSRKRNGISARDVVKQIAKLFEGHFDLVRDFSMFLPSNF